MEGYYKRLEVGTRCIIDTLIGYPEEQYRGDTGTISEVIEDSFSGISYKIKLDRTTYDLNGGKINHIVLTEHYVIEMTEKQIIDENKDKLIKIIKSHLNDAYFCNKVWEACRYDSRIEEDIELVVGEMAEEIINMLK